MEESPAEADVENVKSQHTSGPTKAEQYRAAIKHCLLRQRIAFRRFIRRTKRYAARYKEQDRGYYGNELRFTLADWHANRHNILRRALGIGWWNVNRGQLLFAGILTFATIATWIVMLMQNNIMREQMRQADETLSLMQRDLAALVVVSSPLISNFEAGKIPEFYFVVSNPGKSAAYVNVLKYKAFFEDEGVDLVNQIPEWNEYSGRNDGIIIAPDGGEYDVRFVVDKGFPAKEIEHVKGMVRVNPKAGARMLYFVVIAEYTDYVGTDGLTVFLTHYSPELGRFVADSEYSVMEQHRPRRGKQQDN